MCRFRFGVAAASLMLAWAVPVVKADLVPGDVAVIQIFTDNPDTFSWVAMVDIAPGALVMLEEAASAPFAPGDGFVTADERHYGETVVRFIEAA